jgi:hypothetical protein
MGGDQAVELLHADRATRGDDHSAVETNLRPGPATGRQKPRPWREGLTRIGVEELTALSVVRRQRQGWRRAAQRSAGRFGAGARR